MAVNDIYRLALEGKVGADDNVNVLHYRVTTSIGPGSNEAESLAKAFEAECLTEYLACLSSVYAINTIKVRGVTTPTFGIDYTATGNGARDAEVAPTQTSALINWRTTNFGRSFRGKTYLPALAEPDVAQGSITPTLVGLIGAWVTEALTLNDITFGGIYAFQLGIYSRTLGVITDVTTHQVSQFAATQRRRKPGVGS